MIVDIEKFIECVGYIEAINKASVDDLQIKLNGEVIKPSQKTIDNFKMTGMDNCKFVDMALYIEERDKNGS